MSKYRDELGGTLIYEYGAKPPYSFITRELIDNTYTAVREGSYKNCTEFDTREFRSGEFESFEHGYHGEYIVVKAYIGEAHTPIYLASEKDGGIITLSTNNVVRMLDKEGLDTTVLANTYNLKTNILAKTRVHKDGRVDAFSNGLYMFEDGVDFHNSETHSLYLKGKIYYIKIGKTLSGYEVLGASESPDGPFSVTMFNNEISNDFHNARYMRTPNNYEQRIKGRAYGSSHKMGFSSSTGKLKGLDDVKSNE